MDGTLEQWKCGHPCMPKPIAAPDEQRGSRFLDSVPTWYFESRAMAMTQNRQEQKLGERGGKGRHNSESRKLFRFAQDHLIHRGWLAVCRISH